MAPRDRDDGTQQHSAAKQGDWLAVLRSDLLQVLRLPTTSTSRAKALNVLFYKVELAVENAALVQRMEAARRRSFEHMAGLLERAVHAGQLPAGRDVERDARFLLFSVFGALLDWLWDPCRFDLAAQAAELVDAWMLPLGMPQVRPAHRAVQAGTARAACLERDQD